MLPTTVIGETATAFVWLLVWRPVTFCVSRAYTHKSIGRFRDAQKRILNSRRNENRVARSGVSNVIDAFLLTQPVIDCVEQFNLLMVRAHLQQLALLARSLPFQTCISWHTQRVTQLQEREQTFYICVQSFRTKWATKERRNERPTETIGHQRSVSR